ncbi:MAG: hypothetical protein H7Y04_05710 [Verrucomicrobia bacterium]|nr:hypothetical protein [Cytophagales bacterium]
MPSFKNFKSLFFVEGEETKNSNPPEQKTTPPPVTTTMPPVPQTIVSSGTAALDQRIFDSLLKALESNNMQGFDYFEFKNALKTLESIIPDQSMRFRSAFATAASMGVTVDKLLESGKYYKEVLAKEQQKFSDALASQTDNGVVAKQKEIERLNQTIQQKSQQIQQLTQEIQTHQGEIANLQTTMAEVTTKIEVTKNNFQFTYQTVVGQIDDDLTNIERYLKTTA